jgi:hypothetical protein
LARIKLVSCAPSQPPETLEGVKCLSNFHDFMSTFAEGYNAAFGDVRAVLRMVMYYEATEQPLAGQKLCDMLLDSILFDITALSEHESAVVLREMALLRPEWFFLKDIVGT